ncbi:uncharacterized protein LOC143079965 [Mytilus galloprovincialis]|uniref:uncharacterized protein LOC143079965 n=1 Tax=Mytilus galloprovincialis TaxID=29158 RepID=UPI003F7BB5A6
MTRNICFVCGSRGAENKLRIKPCDNEPYFPFLEHHDPPKGSSLPSKDGIVDSCRVCTAFLCQQWEAYERSHTPAIKRLYWLKRADNGHFTGAEMRLQGEYIAQIMGLQYQPGAFDGRTSPVDIGRESGMREVSSTIRHERRSAEVPKEKRHSTSTPQQKPTPSIQPTMNVPLYNSNNRNQMTSQGQSGLSDGVLDLSVTKKNENSKDFNKNPTFLCYLCAHQTNSIECKIVNSVRRSNSEPYFPVIQSLPCIPGAVPLNELGQARVCVPCKNSLFQQWQAYEMSGIPAQHRNYKVYEIQELKMLRASAATLPGIQMQQDDLSPEKLEHVCYICGNVYAADLIRSLFTAPSNEPSMGTLFFPFVRELSRPAGAEPLRSDGSVLACRNCYEALYKQWQLQEMERIPLAQRQYTLSFLGSKTDMLDSSFRIKQMKEEPVQKITTTRETKSPKPDLIKPLNIQISENTSEDTNTLLASQGLLAIASSGSSAQDDVLIPKSKSPFRANKSPAIETIAKTVPHPLQQATTIPKKICFLCGEKCRLSKAHVLCSYPTRHEAKTLNNQTVPFFPFLANREPAPKGEPMTEDGTVISCDVCFHILIQQWNDYEENKTGDSNRWLRKYNLPDFVCCLCSKWMKHKNIQLLSCKTFPFLKDIKPSNTAPTIEDGYTVGVCKACACGLNHQNTEYERMGVPYELRKFNWTTSQADTGENREDDYSGDEDSNKINEQEQREDTRDSFQEDSEDVTGTGQNVKPPPLNMLSGSKLSRNTATVPPLNQSSPSNGLTSNNSNAALNATRTSSFAAALRKLAHQAKDPEDTPTKHGSQPGSSSTSPRATTPKRGPPPLVYTSHSSVSSPPVVTIAPTQSHASLVSTESRQSLDRTHSVHSSLSTYDGLSNMKADRPHSTQSGREEDRYRPQSSHSSRDDDRLSAKDMAPSRRTPLSAQSSTSPAVTREESIMRGFQPYRPGDDLRHSLPPFGLDAAAYPYPAFLPPHAFPHPAFRFDDPLLIERYRMMQPHYLPFAHPGMLPPPGGLSPFLTGRYPPELLHQQLPYVSQSSRLPDLSPSLLERQRLEEERMRDLEKEQREKEKEAILLREKERAREREKEYDKLRESMSHDYRSHPSTELRVPHHIERGSSGIDLRTQQYSSENKKSETKDRNHNERGPGNNDAIPRSVEGHKFGSITHGTPREYNLNDKSSREFQYNSDSDRFKASRRDMEQHKHSHHDISKLHSHHHDKHASGHHDHRDKKYSLLNSGHHSDKNRTQRESESKVHKSSDSIFRPFDTSNLTNGHLPAHNFRDGGNMPNVERTMEAGQGRLPNKENTSALKHSVGMTTKSGNFNLNHVIDASKMHYKEHHAEHLHLATDKNRGLVISSLDIGWQKLQKRRMRGELSDDSEMDEIVDYLDESHKQSLMMVTKGPPLPLDVSREKVKFLQQIGLTSQKVKRDLEYKKIRRRRRRHREPSVSPVLMVDGDDKRISPSPKVDPEVLRREPDYPNKCSFLGSFSLGTVESEKKKGSPVKRKGDKRQDEHSGKKVSRTTKSEKVKLFSNKNSDKTLSREFAQEFHNSVLQSTQQKQINGRLGLDGNQGETSQSLKPTISCDSPIGDIPKWPGIDILMESYQKYQEEFKLEKSMLQDRCRNLQTTNQDFNKRAEELSKKMSEFLDKKKQLEDSRLENQGAIDSLKQIIKDMK